MGRPKSTGETKSHQQHVLMTPSEVQAIDDWRFANRIGSRGEAIRRLCQNGIAVEEEISLTLEEAAELRDEIVSFHDQLWTIMMQVAGHHDHANPKLPAKDWSAEDVVDRSLNWMSDLLDRSQIVYLDLLRLNNRVMEMSQAPHFAGAKAAVRRERDEIDARRQEIFRRRDEGEENRRLGLISNWLRSSGHDEAYEAMTEEAQDQFWERVLQHAKEVAAEAIAFSDEEQAKVERRNDEPYDFRGVADTAAIEVLMNWGRSLDAHVEAVLRVWPTADRTMIGIMVEKSVAASDGRDVSLTVTSS